MANSGIHSTSTFRCKHGFTAPNLTPSKILSLGRTQGCLVLYLGIAAKEVENGDVEIAFCVHDGTYSTDFAVHVLRHDINKDRADEVGDYIMSRVQVYEVDHFHKYVGAGITVNTRKISPSLPSRLWLRFDIVPMVFTQILEYQEGSTNRLEVDEEADSMARKCIMYVLIERAMRHIC